MALEHLAQSLRLTPDTLQSGVQQLTREHTVYLGRNTVDGRLKKFYVRVGASNDAGCTFSLQSRDTVGRYYFLGLLITLDAYNATQAPTGAHLAVAVADQTLVAVYHMQQTLGMTRNQNASFFDASAFLCIRTGDTFEVTSTSAAKGRVIFASSHHSFHGSTESQTPSRGSNGSLIATSSATTNTSTQEDGKERRLMSPPGRDLDLQASTAEDAEATFTAVSKVGSNVQQESVQARGDTRAVDPSQVSPSQRGSSMWDELCNDISDINCTSGEEQLTALRKRVDKLRDKTHHMVIVEQVTKQQYKIQWFDEEEKFYPLLADEEIERSLRAPRAMTCSLRDDWHERSRQYVALPLGSVLVLSDLPKKPATSRQVPGDYPHGDLVIPLARLTLASNSTASDLLLLRNISQMQWWVMVDYQEANDVGDDMMPWHRLHELGGGGRPLSYGQIDISATRDPDVLSARLSAASSEGFMLSYPVRNQGKLVPEWDACDVQTAAQIS